MGLVVGSSSRVHWGIHHKQNNFHFYFLPSFFNFISLNFYLKTTIYILILAFYSYSVLIFNKQFYNMHVFCQYSYDIIINSMLDVLCSIFIHPQQKTTICTGIIRGLPHPVFIYLYPGDAGSFNGGFRLKFNQGGLKANGFFKGGSLFSQGHSKSDSKVAQKWRGIFKRNRKKAAKDKVSNRKFGF